MGYVVGERYRILKLQGKGGMGAVYKAQDIRLGDVLRAVKEMSQNELQGQELQEAIKNFEQEANILAGLRHPNLPSIHDHVSEQGRHYLVMDFIDGITLEERLTARGGSLPVEEVLAIAMQLCDVLHYLHSRKPPIIFRDLKPTNIMLTADSTLFLIDFGIARIFKSGKTKDTTIMGTPGFAAPEQGGVAQTTSRADIYALGANMHLMLSGADPPDDQSFHFVALHLGRQPALAKLETLIMQMVKYKAAERPASMAEVRLRLEEIKQQINSQPQPVKGPHTVTVAKTGGDYASINEAIQAVAANTRIWVRPGTYHEGILIDKPLEIVGDGPRERIIIECSHTNCIRMEADSATVRHLTIRGRAGIIGMRYFTVDIPRGQLHLIDCDITSDSSACVGIHNVGANPIIQQCVIHDGTQGGVFIYDNGQGVIENCDIIGNALAGIRIAQAGNPAIRNCQVLDSTGTGVSIYESGEGIIEDCDIFGNAGAGIEIRDWGKPIIRNCKVHDSEQSGIEVYGYGQGVIEDCEIFGNTNAGIAIREEGNPIIRSCKVYNGKTCGLLVYQSGQGAIEHCDIFSNTYSAIEIRDEGHPNIQQCQMYDNEQNGVFVYNNGQGVIDACDIFDNAYSGVEITEDGNPRITRCRINRNIYAVYAHDKGSGVIEDCDLTDNQNGAWKISRDSRIRWGRNRHK